MHKKESWMLMLISKYLHWCQIRKFVENIPRETPQVVVIKRTEIKTLDWYNVLTEMMTYSSRSLFWCLNTLSGRQEMLFLLSNLKMFLIISWNLHPTVWNASSLTSCWGRKGRLECWKQWRPNCCQTKSLRRKN